MIGGAALDLVGTILVTIVFNVPRNNALAAMDPSTADRGRLWPQYVATWTVWNHVRTAAALIAAGLVTFGFGMSLRRGAA